MSYQPYDTRSTVRALTGLDIGLRVRIQVHSPQAVIASGPRNESVLSLISDFAGLVGSLRVHSYALRGQLEQATTALQLNAEGGCRFSGGLDPTFSGAFPPGVPAA